MLTFTIYRTAIFDESSGYVYADGRLGECYGLWVAVWLLYWGSAAILIKVGPNNRAAPIAQTESSI